MRSHFEGVGLPSTSRSISLLSEEHRRSLVSSVNQQTIMRIGASILSWNMLRFGAEGSHKFCGYFETDSVGIRDNETMCARQSRAAGDHGKWQQKKMLVYFQTSKTGYRKSF